jgi:hypothetical protein
MILGDRDVLPASVNLVFGCVKSEIACIINYESVRAGVFFLERPKCRE